MIRAGADIRSCHDLAPTLPYDDRTGYGTFTRVQLRAEVLRLRVM